MARRRPCLRPEVQLHVVLDNTHVLSPKFIDLVECVRDTGSIAAASRNLGISYKRAWHLLTSLNPVFANPIVTMQTGGIRGGGAVLTELGTQVLDAYRSLEQAAATAGSHDLQTIRRALV